MKVKSDDEELHEKITGYHSHVCVDLQHSYVSSTLVTSFVQFFCCYFSWMYLGSLHTVQEDDSNNPKHAYKTLIGPAGNEHNTRSIWDLGFVFVLNKYNVLIDVGESQASCQPLC